MKSDRQTVAEGTGQQNLLLTCIWYPMVLLHIPNACKTSLHLVDHQDAAARINDNDTCAK